MYSHTCVGTGGPGRSSTHSHLWADDRGGWVAQKEGRGGLEASSLRPRYKRGMGRERDPGSQHKKGPRQGRGEAQGPGRKAVRVLEGGKRQRWRDRQSQQGAGEEGTEAERAEQQSHS